MLRVWTRACALLLCAAAATQAAARDESLTLHEARAIAKEATIYGFALVDHYRIQHAYFVDRANPEFKAPWNQISNEAKVFTPEDRAMQTPNSDTPYSHLGADLRTEPLVLTLPQVDGGRYFSAQFIDLYTHNFAYARSRSTGNGGGRFLLAGPGWKGQVPAGINAVMRSETEFAFVFFRTQSYGSGDIDEVKKVQAGYQVQPLSAWFGQPAPAPAPTIEFMKPLGAQQELSSLEFFEVLNFVLKFCPTHPSEQALMQRLARLDIGAGKTFAAQTLKPDLRKAVEDGMADAVQANEEQNRRSFRGEVTSADLTGSREQLNNNYLYRMRAAASGIYGNSKEEAIYPVYYLDNAGRRVDGSQRYTLRFAPGQLPPVNAFWSLTMYELPSRMLVANPLQRYLINSAMLPQLKRDTDGGITLHVQRESPGAERASNWLPAPQGPFVAVLRLFWPQPQALNGEWKPPTLTNVGSASTPSLAPLK